MNMNFDLQMFASEVQTTAMEGLTAEMKTFYDMTLIDEAGANLVHDQFGQRRPIPANGGKIIEFRKFASLPKATTPLTEGVTPDGKSLSVTTVTATVNQYGDYITQSDVLELTALDNTILETTKVLGRQAGLTLDTVVRNVLHSGTNVTYCPKVVDGVETEVTSRSALGKDCQLTVDVVRQVVAKLRAQNAPTINGKYVAIIHPSVSFDLRESKGWIEAHKYAATTELFNGEIGELHGVRFVETNLAGIVKEGDVAVYQTMFFGKDAFGVIDPEGAGMETIIKDKGQIGGPLNQFSTIGTKFSMAAKILYPERLLTLESLSSYSAIDEAN